MREINDLRQIMWEKTGKAGCDVEIADPFPPIPPMLRHSISHASLFASVHFCPPSDLNPAGFQG
jgi:hypothetical protein